MFAEVDSPVTAIMLIAASVIVIRVVTNAARDVVRRRQMRCLAANCGLIDIKGILPMGIPVPITEGEGSGYSIQTGMWGRYLDRDIAVFDLRTGYGLQSLTQTVVAARGQLRHGGRSSAVLIDYCEIQVLDGWVVAFLRGRLLDTRLVETVLTSFLDAVQ